MKLVIENVAPGGPAHTVIVDGRAYPVESFTPSGDGMTETFELEGDPVEISITVQGSVISERELADMVRAYLRRPSSPERPA